MPLNAECAWFCFSCAAWSCVPENQIWISRSSYSQGTGNCVLLLVAGHLFMVCILPCRNRRVKVLTSFVYIAESAILHLARFKFRMNRLVRENARLAVVANPVSIYVPAQTNIPLNLTPGLSKMTDFQ